MIAWPGNRRRSSAVGEIRVYSPRPACDPGTPHGLSIGKVAEFRRQGLTVLYMTGARDVMQFVQFAPGAPVLLHNPFPAGELAAAAAKVLS